MRLLAWLVLTALPIGIISQMPNDIELETEMVAYSDQGRAELERLWADTGTPTSNQQTVRTTVALPTTTPTPYQGEGGDEPAYHLESTTTTTVPAVRCAEWWHAAVVAGWPAERIPKLLDSIVWAESRCQPDATNGADWGLAQINWATWSHLVDSMGLKRDHLMQPELNLRVALLVAQEAENQGWRWCQPWDNSGNHC